MALTKEAVNLLLKGEKDKLYKKIVAATYPREKKRVRKDRQVEKIEEFIANNTIGDVVKKDVAKLVSLIIGKDIIYVDKNQSTPFRKYMAIVPTGCNNGHYYTLGKVCVCEDGNDIFWDVRWKTENHMSKSESNWRIATRKEIREYVNQLPVKAFV